VAGPAPADPRAAFAAALASQAGIDAATPLRADLSRSLTDALRDLAAAKPAQAEWYQATGLARLADGYAPLSATHRPPGAADAAALRAVALALAGVAGVTADEASLLRTAAATVTRVEQRRSGGATAGESVVLALE
jgi:hypothetical protein